MASVSGLNNSQNEQGKQSNLTFNPALEAKKFHGAIQPLNFPALPVGWVSTIETLKSSIDQTQLFLVNHHPQEWTGHRTLLVFHGLGEHGGRYLHVPHYVSSVVDSVICMDHRGHGLSEGLRGHVEQFSHYAEDVLTSIEYVDEKLKARFGKSEIHILAHSMGGLIALMALFERSDLPVRSVTLSAPLLGIQVKVPAFKKFGAQLIANVWSTLHIKSEVNPAHLSHDPEVSKAYLSDRLVHNKVTPRFFVELQAAIEKTSALTEGLNYPLLLLLPLQDEIVDSAVSQNFFKNLNLKDKDLKTYPKFYHEILNEVGKEKVFADLTDWVRKHSDHSVV